MRRLLAGEVYQAPLGRYVRVVNDVEAADLRAGRAFEVVEVCASTLRDLPNRRGFFIDREYLSESPVGMAGRVSPGGRGVEEGLDLQDAQEGPFPALGDPISGGLVPPQLEPIQNDSGASNRVETSDRPAESEESEESEESGGWDLSIGAIEVLPAGSIDVGDWVVTTNPWAVGADTRLPWALAGRVVAVGPVYHQVLIGTGGGGTFRPEDLRAIRLDASRVPQRAALVVVGNCGSVSARLAGLVQVPDWDETSQEWLRMTGRGVRYAAALLEQALVGRASSLVGFEAGLLGLNTPGLAGDIWRSLLACCPEAEPESLTGLGIEAETESVLGSLTDGIIDAAVARGSPRLQNGEETPPEDVAWLALLDPRADLDLCWLAEAFFTVGEEDDGLFREDDGLVVEDDDL